MSSNRTQCDIQRSPRWLPRVGDTNKIIAETTQNMSNGYSACEVKLNSEKYTQADQSMSLSPTPSKQARVDLDKTNYNYEKKEADIDRVARIKSTVDATDFGVQIKAEPEDDEKAQTKIELYSFPDSGSRSRSNSLHSTTSFSGRKNRTGSASYINLSTVSSYGVEESKRLSPHAAERPSTSLGFVKNSDSLHDQPDSSTGTCEQLMRGSSRRSVSSFLKLTTDQASVHQPASTSTSNDEPMLCQVCGDLAAGFYCNAYICEACKKFFIRASKLETPRYVCLRQKNCAVTKESRVHCQHCRYQKCLQLNMLYSKDGRKNAGKLGVQEIPCRVCSAPSSGFHFGALTCEGCKGFFRRMVKEREAYSYKCSRNGKCAVNAMTRNMCKACRYNKCLQIGMSVEGSRIGRQPNAIKHAISLEARKQAALKSETDSIIEATSSPSNFSFDSVILDPCLPGDVDDSLHSVNTHRDSASVCPMTSQSITTEDVRYSLHSVNMHQDSASVCPMTSPSITTEDVRYSLHSVNTHQDSASVCPMTSPSITTEDVRYKQEPQVSDSQDNCLPVETAAVHHISSPSPHYPSDIFRTPHHNVPFAPESHCHHQDQFSTGGLNPSSSVSFTTSRNMDTETFGRYQTEMHTSSIDNEPQDLSIDLSMHRSATSSSIHNIPHCTQSSIKPEDLSSQHECSTVQQLHISPCYNSSNDYIPQAHQTYQHSYHHSSSTIQDEQQMTAYLHRGSEGNSSSVYNIQCYNQYSDHDSRHIPQNEAYFNRISSSTPQPLGHYSSYSSDYNREQDIHDQHQVYTHHNLYNTNHIEQPQICSTGQNSRDNPCTHIIEHHVYPSHLTHSETCKIFSNRQGFQDHNCQACETTQTYKLSRPHTPYSSDMPIEPVSYVNPQCQLPSPAITPTLNSQKLVRQSPTPGPNYDLLQAPSPAPIPEKIAASRDHSYMYMSNKELHTFMLEAAKNLAHFCVVHRAKSGGFDENRFKDVDSTWEKMMDHFHFHAKSIVRFAKRVPGFRRLKIDDQVVLLRLATYSLVILNHSRAFELETGFYNYFNFTQKEIKRISELFPELDILHSHYKRIGAMTHRLNLTEAEYAYMSCMLLLNDEYPGLEDTDRTKELKERYLDAFQDYEIEQFSSGSLRFGQLLLILAEFAQISVEHNVAVGLAITKNSQLHIPQLYAEMYAQNKCTLNNSESTT